MSEIPKISQSLNPRDDLTPQIELPQNLLPPPVVVFQNAIPQIELQQNLLPPPVVVFQNAIPQTQRIGTSYKRLFYDAVISAACTGFAFSEKKITLMDPAIYGAWVAEITDCLAATIFTTSVFLFGAMMLEVLERRKIDSYIHYRILKNLGNMVQGRVIGHVGGTVVKIFNIPLIGFSVGEREQFATTALLAGCTAVVLSLKKNVN